MKTSVLKQWRKRAAAIITGSTAAVIALGMGVGTASAAMAPAYIALGDSVSAGYGAGAIASSANAAACERTVAAYPTLLASSRGFTGTNLSCAGATASTGLNGAQTRNGVTIPSQISQFKQLPKKPKLVTLTVGANDVHWNEFLGLCLQPNASTDPGCATPQNTAAFTAYLEAAKPQITQALKAIKDRSPQQTIVTGYYDPFGATAPAFGLTSAEITWYRDRIAQLNTTLKDLAKANCADFVSLASLDGAAGDIILSSDPLHTYGFAHPSPLGQAKIATAVAAALNTRH